MIPECTRDSRLCSVSAGSALSAPYMTVTGNAYIITSYDIVLIMARLESRLAAPLVLTWPKLQATRLCRRLVTSRG